jgi:hypothetical protein
MKYCSVITIIDFVKIKFEKTTVTKNPKERTDEL